MHIARRVASDRGRGPEAVIAGVIDLAADLDAQSTLRGLEVVGACVAVPGTVDERRGIARFSVTMGWTDVPIGDRLAARLDRPVAVSHDVRAGAVAESSFGAAVGCSSALFLPIGTGIAAALVVDGTIISGSSFRAGELGQVLVAAPTTGASPRTASLVPLEATSAARGIGERFARACGRPAAAVSAEEVAAAAASGDKIAIAVWTEAIERLGAVRAVAVATFDPAVVIVGGGLSRAGTALLLPLEWCARRRPAGRSPGCRHGSCTASIASCRAPPVVGPPSPAGSQRCQWYC